MNVGVRVTDIDSEFKRRVKNLQKLNNKKVKAGVLASSGVEDNGTSLVDVAFYNEFGTSKIPARPFVRIASERNKQTWTNEAERVVDKIVAGYDANFSILGSRMVENIKDVIGDKNLLVFLNDFDCNAACCQQTKTFTPKIFFPQFGAYLRKFFF